MTLTDVRDWVVAALPSGFSIVPYWVESSFPPDWVKRYCVVQQMGGGGPAVDVRYARYRVVLLGPRNDREDYTQIMAAAEALLQASMGDSAPCGAANIRAIAEPIGPGFTTENRAWAQVDFEIII